MSVIVQLDCISCVAYYDIFSRSCVFNLSIRTYSSGENAVRRSFPCYLTPNDDDELRSVLGREDPFSGRQYGFRQWPNDFRLSRLVARTQ